MAKQAADLHTSTLDQHIVHRYLADFDSEAHVERVRQAYGERYAVMDSSLRSPDVARQFRSSSENRMIPNRSCSASCNWGKRDECRSFNCRFFRPE
jgi:hypothetical protein